MSRSAAHGREARSVTSASTVISATSYRCGARARARFTRRAQQRSCPHSVCVQCVGGCSSLVEARRAKTATEPICAATAANVILLVLSLFVCECARARSGQREQAVCCTFGCCATPFALF